MGTLSVHGILDVIEWLRKGVALFDSEATSISMLASELVEALVDQGVAKKEQAARFGETMAMHHHHVTEKKKENIDRTHKDEAMHRCGCDVLVGAVDFLDHPIAAFVRLNEPQYLGEMTTEGHYPTRFIFMCIGPQETTHQRTTYHEAGRAFSCLMSNRGFLDIAAEALSKQIVCEAIHTFLAESDIIPQFHHMHFNTDNLDEATDLATEKTEINDSDSEDENSDRPLLLSTRRGNEVWKLSRVSGPSKPGKVKEEPAANANKFV